MANLVSEYLKVTEENITGYLHLITKDFGKVKVIQEYATGYMETRYYNDKAMNPNSFRKHVYEQMAHYRNKLIKKYPEDEEIIAIIYPCFYLLYSLDTFTSLDSVEKTIELLNSYRPKPLHVHGKTFRTELFKKVKANFKHRDKLLATLESEDFNIGLKETNRKKIYLVDLIFNMEFHYIYSQYAIENAFNTSLVNEDKLFVLYNMLAGKILRDIIAGDFSETYLVPLANTILEKSKKISTLLTIIDSDIIKDRVSLVINYADYLANKDAVLTYRKEGFNFAVVIDDTYVDSIVNQTGLQVFKYIIIKDEKFTELSVSKKPNVVIAIEKE